MKVSVIIPFYNAADTLELQLNALSDQKWRFPWELILSDNGSTDDSLNIANSYYRKIPNLRIIDSSDFKGPAHARNRGAHEARGESLLFCDADDEVAPGWVAAMGDALEDNDFVTCRFEPYKLSSSWAVTVRQCPQMKDVQSYDYPPFLPHAASAGIGVKKRIHESVNGFDENMPMLEDTDYCWRIQLNGTKLTFVPDALIHYRFRDSLFKSLKQSKLWGEYNVFLYKRYRSFGMPALSKKRGLRKSWGLLKAMPSHLIDNQKRRHWLWQFFWQYGRFRGSIKYRVFAL